MVQLEFPFMRIFSTQLGLFRKTETVTVKEREKEETEIEKDSVDIGSSHRPGNGRDRTDG